MEKETALKILRELHDKALFSERTALETLVPELESEDEKIRNEIIMYIGSKDIDLSIHNRWLTWLEKQGEQKPAEWSKRQVVDALTSMLTERIKPLMKKKLDETINDREKMFMSALDEIRSFVNSPSFQVGKDVSVDWSEEDEKFLNYAISLTDDAQIKKFLKSLKDRVTSHLKQEGKESDKIEPMLKVGDWIINNDERIAVPIQILKVEKYGYITSRGYTLVDKVNTDYHIWTIKDAKEGDVLIVNNNVFIYAHRKQMYSIAVAHCFVGSAGDFHFDGEFGYTENGNSIYPATKEQRDILFSKMKESGYEWDTEKKS